MKLFEAFAENAPQFVLQMAICIQFGEFGVTQRITIASSMFMFARAATDIFLLLPTSQNEVRKKSWQDTLVIMFSQGLLVYPRMFSACILVACFKYWVFVPLAIYIWLSIILLRDELKKDSNKTVLGILTNIFGPCIVNDEHSRFFVNSSLIATVFHILCQAMFFLPLLAGVKFSPFALPSILLDQKITRLIFVGNVVLLMTNIPISCFLQNYLDPVYRMKLSVRDQS